VIWSGIDLGDTIDALLARLDDSFQAQRAFVANASLVQEIIDSRAQIAATQNVAVHAATISGDLGLARQLVSNLLDNALPHNHSRGEVRVTVGSDLRRATLSVQNTGTLVLPSQVDRLLQPFRRLATDRTAESPGHGLGLSIVAAIAAAHNASLDILPDPHGGLSVNVGFPPARPPGRTG
jgi:signal transduction histidine kinase